MDYRSDKNILEILTNETQKYITKASEIYNRPFPMPKISIKLTGTRAGTADSNTLTITYNPELYVQNKEVFLARTVPHEVAHIICRIRFDHSMYYMKKIRSHGNEWKQIMRELGVADIKRTHSYDTSTLVNKRKHNRPYLYNCGCRDFNVTLNLHRKMSMGRYRICKQCKGKLVLKGTVGITGNVTKEVPITRIPFNW